MLQIELQLAGQGRNVCISKDVPSPPLYKPTGGSLSSSIYLRQEADFTNASDIIGREILIFGDHSHKLHGVQFPYAEDLLFYLCLRHYIKLT